MASPLLLSLLLLLPSLYQTHAHQLLPPAPFSPAATDTSSTTSSFDITSINPTIHVLDDFANHRDTGGLTLIPPSAYEFATVFREELESIWPRKWSIQRTTDSDMALARNGSKAGGIVLGRFRSGQAEAANQTYANGEPTEEAYELDIGHSHIFIGGTGSRGMWWGTRTLLQLLLLNGTILNTGRTVDRPAYATRGYMLDAGRKWYAPSFLKELCTYASFFKMSEFHYHMSDNYPLNRGRNETWTDVYSHFSLMPDDVSLRPLIQRPNETLSRHDYSSLEQHCALHGITIIPEIEAPGHCLFLTKWKPELALASKKDLLNLTHPAAIATVKRIWDSFLPWFHTREVHIGADEYDAKLADDYIHFVNNLTSHIHATTSKRVRIWGTNEPSPTNQTLSKDVVVQHWQYGESDPVALQKNGHDLINSGDWWAYMTLKNNHMPILPAPYPQSFNTSRVFRFADQNGWQWTPALVNPVNRSLQLDEGAAGLKGAVMAAWNDNGPDATTQLEAYYAMRRGIPLVAARAWTGARGPQMLSEEGELDRSVDVLSSRIPGQNLDRRLGVEKTIESTSGNEASVRGALLSWSRQPSDGEDVVVSLGHGSKGVDYTLSLIVTGPFTLSSPDVTLSLTSDGTLAFIADGWMYPLRSVSVADGFDPGHPGRIWVNASSSTHAPVTIQALPATISISTDVLGGSRVWVNGSFVGRFEVFVYGGRNTQFSWSQMAFVAPLDRVEGGVQAWSVIGNKSMAAVPVVVVVGEGGGVPNNAAAVRGVEYGSRFGLLVVSLGVGLLVSWTGT